MLFPDYFEHLQALSELVGRWLRRHWRNGISTVRPAVTLDGLADGNFPTTDGAASAGHFTGPRVHDQVPDAGHNLPQEAPEAFADAVLDVAKLISRW